MNRKRIANIRVGLLITCMILGFALLLLIRYAAVNVEAQSFVTVLVRIYIFGAIIMSGVMAWLKRKLDT